MKDLLDLFARKVLSRERAFELLTEVTSGKYPPAQVAAFLTVFELRPISLQELQGFREALLKLCVPIDLGAHKTLDLVGTGGDHKNTFNISTLAAFVVAASGVKLAKHGNYAASSRSGSSNLLEAIGVKFYATSDQLQRCLTEVGICFLHAPLFHPALKSLAVLRKELGFRTFINLLGPLVNPARPSFSVIGVARSDILRLYSYLLQGSSQGYMLLHSLCGYDEISLTGQAKVITNKTEMLIEPEELGCKRVRPDELEVKDLDQAKAVFMKILQGKGSQAETDVVAANAGLAIYLAAEEKISCNEGVSRARELLLSGQAFALYQRLIEVSKSL